MELPSMVERTGNGLVVRSLVSGTAVYQTAEEQHSAVRHALVDAELLERQLQSYPTPVARQLPTAMSSIMDLGAAEPGQTSTADEELPQCKIRRNYSCTQCGFFTQNPRSHLSHLRDVHGERIIINECKLCLYASRHFQKLVRHMKMVHGCVDDADSQQSGGSLAQLRRRRSANREARKRRLEESVDPTKLSIMMQNGPSLEQLKCELQAQEQLLMHNVQVYTRQQELQQLQQIVANNDNIFSMAFEFQSLQQTPRPPQLPMLPLADASLVELPVEPSSSDSEQSPQRESPSPAKSPRKQPKAAGDAHYCCNKCSYSTPVRARFKKHVKYHSMPLIKCNACDFHTPYKWNLDRHTKNHGADGQYRCSACNFSTDIKQSLTIHELNHHVPTVGIQLANARRLQQQQSLEPVASQEERAAPDLPLDGLPSLFAESQPQHERSSPDGSPLLAELAPIHCSHCETMVPNAVELLKHLQQCAPALRTTSLHFQGALGLDLETESSAAVAPADEDYLPLSDLSYVGVETAPGYGEVTEQLSPEDTLALPSLKKVFKCPHCTFWAATASRFHVHIVGHLNRKPFECSLCAYRSNWRWDITKHIRLKTMRDKSHSHAQVLMNDETGRRNYAKYNQFLTLMKVNNECGPEAKTIRSVEPITVPPGPAEVEPKPPVPCEPATTSMASDPPIEIPDAMECEKPVSSKDADVETPQATVETEVMAVENYAVAECSSVEASLACSDQDMPMQQDDSEQWEAGSSHSRSSKRANSLDSEPRSSLLPAEESNAAFRCGLCHQSSNWKHVIQRHSRLKHGGILNIEALIDNVYQKADGKEEPAAEPAADEQDSGLPNDNLSCEQCGFKAQTKQELRKHHAAHKQTAHKCEQCEFACSGKIKLAKHVRLSHGSAAAVVAEPAEATPPAASTAVSDGAQLAYCPQCPTRFVQLSPQDEQFQAEIEQHLAAHNVMSEERQRYGCRYCCFFTEQAAQLDKHMLVHSQQYQLQCQQQYANYSINPNYPAPMMTKIMLDASNNAQQAVWVVVQDPLDEYDLTAY